MAVAVAWTVTKREEASKANSQSHSKAIGQSTSPEFTCIRSPHRVPRRTLVLFDLIQFPDRDVAKPIACPLLKPSFYRKPRLMDLATCTTFLGWCTAINMGLLGLSTIVLMAFRKPILRFHGRVSGLESQDLLREYFRYLANYKIAVIVFNLVPYLVLRFLISGA